ncbi:uncharacterized protein BP5553_00822 [Venustampulla echinocandica]|uniref:Uncharacterized protein n=1 Tax=Venustampulla echinocandica TaxID=2656787 RepID=A0A370TZ79_9HELO|nr:uncharacterized protein BP5553_00822 [Venustampulla echinocandica]RDL40843.1 hypothetical protein BP5553_00822 [Venustampulla echinocandica]
MSSTSAPFFPTINLPLPILIHSVGLSILGLYTTFSSPGSPRTNKTKNPQKNGTPAADPPSSPMLGVATAAIGICYLFTAYMPIEENQFLHASVPIRVILSCIMGCRLLLDSVMGAGKSRLNQKDRKALIGLGIYDGVGGLILGWTLGNWSGRVPGW